MAANTTVLLLFTVCLSLAGYFVEGQTPAPIPDFPVLPTKFHGSFVRNESYASPGGALTTYEVLFNLEARRVYVSALPSRSPAFPDSGEFWLVFAPEGAEPGTPQSTKYVIFTSLKSANQESYCSYTTVPDWPTGTFLPPGKFPPHWINSETNEVEMSEWFQFPSDMAYAGSSVWRGVSVDVWNSETACKLFQRTSPIPCTRLAVKKGFLAPAATLFAHQKKPGSFESDWISFDWWKLFDPENVAEIELPSASWTTKCYNSQNGLVVDPERGYVSTPKGRDSFSLKLSSKPINGLGPVVIQFQPSSTTSTVGFELEDGSNADGLTFTTENWDTPVNIYLSYKAPGETYFTIVATGGGYDIPYIISSGQLQPATSTKSSALRAITCEKGTVGYGCD